MPASLRIAIVSDFEITGGAAIATSRLARGLTERGHRVLRCVANPEPTGARSWSRAVVPSVSPRFPALELASRRLPVVASLECKRRVRGAGRSLLAILERFRPDVVNLHNLHGASSWDPSLASLCARRWPTVWTLHDMWSFTGRCAYACDCERYLAGCDADCPTAHEYPSLPSRRIAPAYRERRRVLASAPGLVAVAPSRWLASCARNGLWQKHRVEVIPNGLPVDAFAQTSPQEARARLGLPPEEPVFVLVCQSCEDRRKGLDLFLSALSHCPLPRVHVLVAGRGSPPRDLPPAVVWHALGTVARLERLAEVYSAGDCYVHPARADNFPNVVLEALASGTPVAAFRVGGLPDAVRPGNTGWLVEPFDVVALGATLARAFHEGVDLRTRCRQVAAEEYALDVQAARYEALFRELLSPVRVG